MTTPPLIAAPTGRRGLITAWLKARQAGRSPCRSTASCAPTSACPCSRFACARRGCRGDGVARADATADAGIFLTSWSPDWLGWR